MALKPLSPERQRLLSLKLQQQGLNAAARESIPVQKNRCQETLSFAQERLWFLEQLQPGSTVYHMPGALRIIGLLQMGALEQAINTIIQRHEILRTTFEVTPDGQPFQVIQEHKWLSISTADLTGLPEKEREETLRELIGQETRCPFDLVKGPLLRVKLLRLQECEHVLFYTMHHIISDGWSAEVLTREFGQLYQAYSSGQPSPLRALPIQYADYAAWQREWMQKEASAKQLNYWKKQLGGWAGTMDMPTDRPRPLVQSYAAESHRFSFSEGFTRDLKELSHKHGATLFMTLLAGLKALLFRYTGASDLAVGIPIANRTRVETEGLIGLFLNTLVVKTSLAGDPTFEDLLKRERETLLDAYAHQDTPFEQLLQELQPGRDITRTALFQVFFNMLNFEKESLECRGLKFEPIAELETPKAKFDIALYAGERNGKFQFELLCSADLFFPESVREMGENFASLLEECVRSPQTPLSSIILQKYKSGPNVHFEVDREFCENHRSAINQSVGARFEQQAGQFGNQQAIKTDSHQWNYSELNRMANKVANKLLSMSKSDRGKVALLFEHGAPMIAAILGALKSGTIYVPLDTTYPKRRLEILLEDCAADVLLIGDTIRRAAADELKFTGARVFWGELGSVSDANPQSSVTADHPAYILYTSGSTGTPKGILQNHRNLQHFIRVYANNLKISSRDNLSLVAPYTCDAAVMDIFGALLNGACLCPRNLKETGFSNLDEWIHRENLTIFHCTPTVYRHFLRTLPIKELLRSIRLVVLGGEQTIKEDVDLFAVYFDKDLYFNQWVWPHRIDGNGPGLYQEF